MNTNTGTLTINGGTISNNGYSGIENSGTLYLYGGTITLNSKGLNTSTDVHIKGTINISNNSGGIYQLYLSTSNNVMIVDGTLTGCSVGIFAVGYPRVITSGFSGKGDVSNFFWSDGSSGGIRLHSSGEAAAKKGISSSLVLNMTGWTYGEEASETSITEGNTGNGAVTYTYKAEGQSEYSETKPINAGTHTVKATIAETDLYLNGERTRTYTVAKREVTLSWDNTSLTYNGSEQKPTAEAGNLVNSDACTVTVSGEQTNPGNYTATATELSNSNYKLPSAKTQTFSISPKDIIVSGITASDKTYDGNTTATIVTTNASLDGLLPGDNVTVSTSGTFADANVGENKTVNFSALILGGASAGNYQLKTGEGVQQSSTTASITPKTVGLNWSATSFDYDGTAKAPTATATDLEAGDECNVTVNVPGEHTAVGFYTATATTLSNTNYALPALATQEYKIVRPMTGIEFTASKHWNTYCAFENLATPEGITAYIVTGTNGDKATTSQIDYIPQGVGVLLYGEAGSDIRASAYTGATGSFTNNKLVGVTAATTIAAEAGYVLYGDAFVLTTGGTLSANRSYLPANGAALTRSLIIEGGDGATSIESIEDHQATDGRWFDMQGRRIDKPQKRGLYILDGKKVVIK